ncbi:MAG: four-carbon acid sugar kinase family protein [Planctomycetales bacterium]|nr:four-carbon acid sugar kinase family protein [Planctomycetales bacterium]
MISRMGCIADDYTGATDLASMLVRAGLRVVQFFGVADKEMLSSETCEIAMNQSDAVVVALKSRSNPANDAVAESLRSLSFLQDHGFDKCFFKYCSTFDSTPRGNIGPVADALADRLNCEQVVFCPAFPENGRTVYQGHLFVGDQLLAESSMRNHPLNPMTDSCLVRWLQAQSKRTVGRLARGSAIPVGRQHLIADAIDDDDLKRVAHLTRNDRLLTGGSAIARYWAEEIYQERNHALSGDGPWGDVSPIESAGRTAVLAGSCSDATRLQIAMFRAQHPALDLALVDEDVDLESDRAMNWIQQQWSTLGDDTPVLIASGVDAERVAGLRRRLGDAQSAGYVESVFARLASQLVQADVTNLIIAGGETSGAVVNALGIHGIRIGSEIASGVPRVYPLERPGMSLVLKSGNFGSDRFILDAIGSDS